MSASLLGGYLLNLPTPGHLLLSGVSVVTPTPDGAIEKDARSTMLLAVLALHTPSAAKDAVHSRVIEILARDTSVIRKRAILDPEVT